MTPLLAVYAFLLGAIVGSFLNVVIHRYPAGLSIVSPPSSCPRCGHRIRPWDNIPILSYLILLGRYRDCRSGISPRYPLIELVTGLFFLATYFHIGPRPGFFLLAAIVAMTLVLMYIDLDIQILPDVIDIPGIAIGLLMGWMHLGDLHPNLVLSSSLLDSAVGALVGSGMLLSVAVIYKWLRKVDGMGMGDVKMLAMIGAVVGWRAVLPVIFLASITGAIFGILMSLRSREGLKFAVPFGVFLGLGFLIVIFFGHTLLQWYSSLLLV